MNILLFNGDGNHENENFNEDNTKYQRRKRRWAINNYDFKTESKISNSDDDKSLITTTDTIDDDVNVVENQYKIPILSNKTFSSSSISSSTIPSQSSQTSINHHHQRHKISDENLSIQQPLIVKDQIISYSKFDNLKDTDEYQMTTISTNIETTNKTGTGISSSSSVFMVSKYSNKSLTFENSPVPLEPPPPLPELSSIEEPSSSSSFSVNANTINDLLGFSSPTTDDSLNNNLPKSNWEDEGINESSNSNSSSNNIRSSIDDNFISDTSSGNINDINENNDKRKITQINPVALALNDKDTFQTQTDEMMLADDDGIFIDTTNITTNNNMNSIWDKNKNDDITHILTAVTKTNTNTNTNDTDDDEILKISNMSFHQNISTLMTKKNQYKIIMSNSNDNFKNKIPLLQQQQQQNQLHKLQKHYKINPNIDNIDVIKLEDNKIENLESNFYKISNNSPLINTDDKDVIQMQQQFKKKSLPPPPPPPSPQLPTAKMFLSKKPQKPFIHNITINPILNNNDDNNIVNGLNELNSFHGRRILLNLTIATDNGSGTKDHSVYTLHVSVPAEEALQQIDNENSIQNNKRTINDNKQQQQNSQSSELENNNNNKDNSKNENNENYNSNSNNFYCITEPPPVIPESPCKCNEIFHSNEIEEISSSVTTTMNLDTIEMQSTSSTLSSISSSISNNDDDNENFYTEDGIQKDKILSTPSLTVTTPSQMLLACPDVAPVLILEGDFYTN